MIQLRKLEHADIDDIISICKDLWDGTDYLPSIFHEWVEDEGLFIGAVDSSTKKVIGLDKYTILHDNSGWLEGLRVHKDYRGQGISKKLAEYTLNAAKKDLLDRKIINIGFGTHITSVESINLMKKYDFKLKQQYLLLTKEYNSISSNLTLEDFQFSPWNPTFYELLNFQYFNKRANILPLTFIFQHITQKLYKELLDEGCFVTINEHHGIYKFKGEPHFIALEDNFESINTFMNYMLLYNKDKGMPQPLTSIMPDDENLINKLKSSNYSTLADWQTDYLYFCNEC